MIKKINTKKGISIIVLLITIAVILILLTAITFSADTLISNTKKRQFAKEIYEVQKVVDKYKYENDDYPYIIENDEKKVFNINVENIDEQFVGEEILNNTVTLYPIELSKTGVQNLSRGTKNDNNENDVYALSDKTGKVYYVKGFKVGRDIYYTLTNELKKLIGVKQLDDSIKKRYNFEQGTFYMQNGKDFSSNTRIRTINMLDVSAGIYTISYVPSDFMWNIFVYDVYGNYIVSETPTVWHKNSENKFEIKG